VLTAMRSEDPSTKCGAVLVDPSNVVVATGYNGFPRGLDDPERWHDREAKYARVIHSELNAVINACNHGRPVAGCTLYVTWNPCRECALLLWQAGIKRVVMVEDHTNDEQWNFGESAKVFADAKIKVETIPFKPIELRRFVRGEVI